LAKQVVLKAEALGALPPLSDLLVEDSWRQLLRPELAKPSFAELEAFVRSQWAGSHMVFPPKDCVFRCVKGHRGQQARSRDSKPEGRQVLQCTCDVHAQGPVACADSGLLRVQAVAAPASPDSCRALNSVPVDRVRVVILGQDPYHDLGQAMGLSFSVPQVSWLAGWLARFLPLPPCTPLYNRTVSAQSRRNAFRVLNGFLLHFACLSGSLSRHLQGRQVPSSLRNIYKELRDDLGCEGSLSTPAGLMAARNGVGLLSALLALSLWLPGA
jgi:uracil DNA glycosylase